jgi:hypothetical protein
VFGGNVKAIANVFLRAKHWQIFFLFFAAPTVAEFSAVVGVWVIQPKLNRLYAENISA